MRNLKRIGAVLTAIALIFSLNLTAFAAVEDTGFSDVSADAWYADAVAYVRDNGLMSGTSETTFEPEGTMTRGMLATTLYRIAGSPSLENENLGYPYADVPGDAWYADGFYWARLAGVVSGYSDERFGPNDPVTREQIAVILWRDAGSPEAQAGSPFADEGSIASWAAQAMDWAQSSGILSGRGDNRFDPQASATRAEVAVMLRAYRTMGASELPEPPAEGSHVLVAYFSATGNTERVANAIAEATGGDLFEITPADPYTDDDLNWTDENSRVVQEYENPDARDTELVAYTPESWADYDVVFVGYPIWWYDAAWPVDGFVAENDFTGKTVTKFAGIMSNPTWVKVQEGAQLARDCKADLVLAVGGGSVIDCCKIVCAQAVTDEELWDLEMVQHKAPSVPPIPLGAVVTASGTGAEMNGGAVITNEEAKIKGGMFAAAPRFAILDPEYTMSLPRMQVLSGAFDTLSHAMETYFGRSDRDNVSDEVALAVMRSTVVNMRTLLKDINDYTARSNLMWTSAMAENGILKAGRVTDFECHQIEHQLGAYTDCNHGQGLAVLHPVYYRHIVKDAPEKFAKLGKVVFDVDGSDGAVDALAAFIQECGLPTRLAELRSKAEITPELLRQVADSTNLLPNGPRQLTHDEVYEILKECL